MVLPVSLRAAWTSAALPAVVVPEAIGTGLAEELRARFDRLGWTRYALVDRGSYDVVRALDEPELFDVLAGIAGEVTGRELRVAEARALRLSPGDYLLTRHDRVHEGRPVEAVLDLSAAAVPRADVHYRHRGQVFFAVAATPGLLSLVERGPTVMSNHAYVTKLWKGPPVVRAVVLLRDAR